MWGVEDEKYEQKHKNLELRIKQAGSKLTVDLAEHYHKQNFLLKFTTVTNKTAKNEEKKLQVLRSNKKQNS